MKPYRTYLITAACLLVAGYTAWMMVTNWQRINSAPTGEQAEMDLIEPIKPLLHKRSTIAFTTNIKDKELATRVYYLAQYAVVPSILSTDIAVHDTVLFLRNINAGDSSAVSMAHMDTLYQHIAQEYTVYLLRKKK